MNPALYRSFLISFSYVLIGTIGVLSAYPSSPLYGDWVVFALLLTLPVTIISFGVMYAEPDATVMVLIIQLVMFLITWYVLYKTLPFEKHPVGSKKNVDSTEN